MDYQFQFWGILVVVSMTVMTPGNVSVPGERIVIPDAKNHTAFIAFHKGDTTVPASWGAGKDFKPLAGFVYYPLKSVHIDMNNDEPLIVDPGYGQALPNVTSLCTDFGRMPASWYDKSFKAAKYATLDISGGRLTAGVGTASYSMISVLRARANPLQLTFSSHTGSSSSVSATLTFASASTIIIGNEPDDYLNTGTYGTHVRDWEEYLKMSADPNSCKALPPSAPAADLGTMNVKAMRSHKMSLRPTMPQDDGNVSGGSNGDCSNTGYP